jgi:hypothetical protein
MFVTCTKLCVCVIHLRTLVSLFYTPGTERQNKLHPYEDVKLNNFSVCNVFISYDTLIPSSHTVRCGSSRLAQNITIYVKSAAITLL